MASRPSRRKTVIGAGRHLHHIQADYIVDLTVDSPRPERSLFIAGSPIAEVSPNETIELSDTDEVDCTNRNPPPEKRPRKTKSPEIEKIISKDVPLIKNPITGELSELSCPVCLEGVSSIRKPMSTRCGHLVCADCIEKICNDKRLKKCPQCQATITLKSCRRLYL